MKYVEIEATTHRTYYATTYRTDTIRLRVPDDWDQRDVKDWLRANLALPLEDRNGVRVLAVVAGEETHDDRDLTGIAHELDNISPFTADRPASWDNKENK
jgi:hypothetical protein